MTPAVRSIVLSALNPATRAFFDAIRSEGLTAPPVGWARVYNKLVIAAMSGTNWWAECDVIRVLCSYDEVVARRNLKQNSFHATTSGTPVFTAKVGFDHNGAGKLVSTYSPTTAPGGQFLQNDCHYGVWIADNSQDDNPDFALWSGSAGSFFAARIVADSVNGRINASANQSVANTDSSGNWVGSRTASTTSVFNKDGTDVLASATTSVAVPSATEEVGAIGVAYTAHTHRFVTIGGGLSLSQIQQRHTDLAAFFAAIQVL